MVTTKPESPDQILIPLDLPVGPDVGVLVTELAVTVPEVPMETDAGRDPVKMTAQQVGRFLLAGNAVCTVVSRKTGGRFTYRVTAPAKDQTGLDVCPEDTTVRFVEVLTGPNNETDYRYIGTVFLDTRAFRWTRKSWVDRDDASFQAFDWTYRNIVVAGQDIGVDVYHEGRCGRCGRRLTTPESIRAGLGPDCQGRVP